MNKAKTLKRKLGNPKTFLSVAWNTDDIWSQTSINPTSKLRDIDWKKVEKYVFKLQKLIYKASSRGEVSKMRKYQKLLTKSYYARLIAVRGVTQDNQGKKTAGLDGIKSRSPMKSLNLVELLREPKLKASPKRRVWIPKPGKEEKPPLSIPTIYDRALQALIKLGMEPEWEARFEPKSYGFRPGRSTHDAIQSIFNGIRYKPKYVLDADISKCFDQINHKALLDKIGKSPFRQLVKQWLKSGVMDNNNYLETVEATPQGGVISPLLANIALHGLENKLLDFIKNTTMYGKKGYDVGTEKKLKSLTVVRYADDFVILHKDLEVILQAKTLIEKWLQGIALEVKPEKIRIAHTLNEYEGNQPGFDFLGFNVRQYEVKTDNKGYKTLIKPSVKSVQRHYRKLAETCDQYKAQPIEKLIKALNPIIRGWANYYSSVVSTEIFSKLDHLLWIRLWRWAKRRHPKKSSLWLKRKYFKTIISKDGTVNRWRFGNDEFTLMRHTDVKIIRHIKVKDNKSPFDGDWLYWSARTGKHIGVKKRVALLLKSQKNKYAHCGLHFRPTDLIEVDHIRPRSKGRKDTYDNT